MARDSIIYIPIENPLPSVYLYPTKERVNRFYTFSLQKMIHMVKERGLGETLEQNSMFTPYELLEEIHLRMYPAIRRELPDYSWWLKVDDKVVKYALLLTLYDYMLESALTEAPPYKAYIKWGRHNIFLPPRVYFRWKEAQLKGVTKEQFFKEVKAW